MLDTLAREIEIGDVIAYKGAYSSDIRMGLVVGSTASDNPRVLVYSGFEKKFKYPSVAVVKSCIILRPLAGVDTEEVLEKYQKNNN